MVAGVRRAHDGAVAATLDGHRQPPADDVVRDPVVDEVRDEALEQPPVALDVDRVAELELEPHPGGVGPVDPVADDVTRELRDVDDGALTHGGLAPREREQRVEQRLAAVGRVPHRGREGLLPSGGVVPRQGEVGLGPHDRERRAQLVGHVRRKRPLGAEGLVETADHAVEGVGELLQLVVGPVERDPLVEVLLRQRLRPGGQAADGPERPAGGDPPAPDREPDHHDQRDTRADQELAQRVGGDAALDAGDDVTHGLGVAAGLGRRHREVQHEVDALAGVPVLLDDPLAAGLLVLGEARAHDEVAGGEDEHAAHHEEQPEQQREAPADGRSPPHQPAPSPPPTRR